MIAGLRINYILTVSLLGSRHIRLSPLKDDRVAAKGPKDHPSRGFLRLGFVLKQDNLSKEQIEELTRHIPRTLNACKVPVLEIKWLGFRKIENPRSFADIVELVMQGQRSRSSHSQRLISSGPDHSPRRFTADTLKQKSDGMLSPDLSVGSGENKRFQSLWSPSPTITGSDSEVSDATSIQLSKTDDSRKRNHVPSENAVIPVAQESPGTLRRQKDELPTQQLEHTDSKPMANTTCEPSIPIDGPRNLPTPPETYFNSDIGAGREVQLNDPNPSWSSELRSSIAAIFTQPSSAKKEDKQKIKDKVIDRAMARLEPMLLGCGNGDTDISLVDESATESDGESQLGEECDGKKLLQDEGERPVLSDAQGHDHDRRTTAAENNPTAKDKTEGNPSRSSKRVLSKLVGDPNNPENRKRRRADESDDTDNDGGRRRRKKDKQNGDGELNRSEKTRRLGCPYFKRDSRGAKAAPCIFPGFFNLSRLK